MEEVAMAATAEAAAVTAAAMATVMAICHTGSASF
jgi:hypothetical protein